MNPSAEYNSNRRIFLYLPMSADGTSPPATNVTKYDHQTSGDEWVHAKYITKLNKIHFNTSFILKH